MDGESESLQSKLTKRNLRLHNKMNENCVTPLGSPSKNSTRSGRSISTTANGFQKQAIANGVLRNFTSKAPQNADQISERLNRSRESPSPPESQFQLYRSKIDKARNETTVMTRMLLLFNQYDGDYNFDSNRAFSGLPSDVGFNDGLSPPQPDYVEGLTREQFDPFDASQIPGAELFKYNPTSITLPHFAGEFKSRTSDIVKAEIQSAYDGASLVYGRNQALEYLNDPDPTGFSAVSTFISNGEDIKFFAHYASLNEDGAIKYHQYCLGKTNLTEDYESFKKGRKQLRNAQDLAREHSLAFRDRLRELGRLKRRRRGTAATKSSDVTSVSEKTPAASASSAWTSIIEKSKIELHKDSKSFLG